MKTFFVAAGFWGALVPASFGYSWVIFNSIGPGVNAPITNASGNLIVGPSSYVDDLFWSTKTEAAMDSLTAFNLPVQFSASAPGYFFGGPRDFGDNIVPVRVQVRVWDSSYGSTFYQAREPGGEFGYSNLLIVVPDPPPGTGTWLTGLLGFQLQRLPRLTSTVTTTNTLVFSWPTEQTSYAVQQNPDLSPTNWTTLPNTPIIIRQQQQLILPVPPTGKAFYRLISQ